MSPDPRMSVRGWRSAAPSPSDESWTELLHRVIDVMEGEGSLTQEYWRSTAARNQKTKEINGLKREATSRRLPRADAYDQALLALLRRLLEKHPEIDLQAEEEHALGPQSPPQPRPDAVQRTRPDDPLAEAFSKILWVGDVRRKLLPEVSPYDESWAMLMCAGLAEREGRGLSVSELCRRIGCALATGQRRVDRLEQLELLERTPDPDDLRRHLILPTDKGRQLVESFIDTLTGNRILQA